MLLSGKKWPRRGKVNGAPLAIPAGMILARPAENSDFVAQGVTRKGIWFETPFEQRHHHLGIQHRITGSLEDFDFFNRAVSRVYFETIDPFATPTLSKRHRRYHG